MRNGLVPRRDDLFFPLEQTFNSFFDDFFKNSLSSLKATSGFPRMNAYESGGLFVLEFAVPGVQAEDLEVQISSDNVLTLRGRMVSESARADVRYVVKELRGGTFERVVRLPESVHGDPDTNLKDGLLTLAWKTELSKPEENIRKIVVKKE